MRGGFFLDCFNIIVGIATIISTICSLASISLLYALNSKIKNKGNDNTNNVLQNRGIRNKNTIHTSISNTTERGGTD